MTTKPRTSRTSAQRYNDKMHKIFEEARANSAKYAPYHMSQVTTRLLEKVERINAIQHSGGTIEAEDWVELFQISKQTRDVLERFNELEIVKELKDGITH